MKNTLKEFTTTQDRNKLRCWSQRQRTGVLSFFFLGETIDSWIQRMRSR